MDSRLLTVFSTLLILFENYRVWSQAIQPTVGPGNSEFSMPTLIKAFAPPWDPKFPNYGNFPSCPPPMPPPIVLADGGYGGKNKWFNFLLLLLALRKNKSGNTRCGGCNGGCSESCGCIDSYDGCDGPYDGGCDSYGYDSGCCSRCGRKYNCGCGGGCNGGCESGCDSGCGGGCDGGCGGGCDGGCGCGCNGGCGGGCKGGCGGGCDGSCGGGCHGRHESEHTSEVINTIMPYPTAVYELPMLPPSPPLLSLPTGYGATTLHDTSVGSSLGIINNLAPLEDIYTCHPTVQTHPGRSPNEVHLIIKTECNCL